MKNRNAINKFFLVFFVIMTFFTEGYAQLKENDPSTWPKPSGKNIRSDGFYNSAEKILTYHKWREIWRKENLPNLYMDQNKVEKIKELFQPIYRLKFEDIARENSISTDSLERLEIKSFTWIDQKLKENESNPCLFLEDFFYDMYAVRVDANNSRAMLTKLECLAIDLLENDEEGEFEIINQGDTLIILKPIKGQKIGQGD